MKTILIVLAHPNFAESRGNKALVEAVQNLSPVTVHNLYKSYPNWEIDIQTEQELLRQHDLIVLQHPLQWYSVPPLLKKWMDDVLTLGFAYGERGTALQGKALMPAITTGGLSEMYVAGGANNFTISELLRPIQQTAHYCHLTYQAPFVIHGFLPQALGIPGAITDEQLHQEANRYKQVLLQQIAS
ncbi:MAG: NAD(P)H-dependent oxidoreductase [Cyanobacteria bacterium J06626_14]